jgi:formate hydrogenlyase subunit 3/multisubunit Na+/H+ antiporter MnhD subunit
MVNPIIIFVLFLGTAFLLSLFDKINRKFSLGILQLVLLINTVIAGQWLYKFVFTSQTPVMIFTAGFKPPFSINLRMGLEEAFILFAVNFIGLLSAIYLTKSFKQSKIYPMVLYLMMIMGINGIVMTRDLFNLFVFLEISSISTYALITLKENEQRLASGFKYMIASGLASIFFLLGTIFIYHITGTLNIDQIIAQKSFVLTSLGFLSVFTLMMSLIIELKPFPANGWALDVYQTATSGVVSIIAVANSAGVFYAFYKLLPLIPHNQLLFIAGIGTVSFVFSNLIALKQTDARRLLGYSSIAQIGLLITVTALTRYLHVKNSTSLFIIASIFLSNFIAKAGLFWIAGIIKKAHIKEWAILRFRPGLLIIFGVFIFALVGIPPFPNFWAKWEIVRFLALSNLHIWIALILIGSLLEAFYLFRWFGSIIRSEHEDEHILQPGYKTVPIILFFLLLMIISLGIPIHIYHFDILPLLPLAGILILSILDFLPSKLKAIISMLIVASYTFYIYPVLSGVSLVFAFIFLAGSFIQLIATMSRDIHERGFFPFLIGMILSMGSMLVARSSLEFFFAWEIMTITAYLLVLRGKKAEKPALLFITFSLAGAYMLLSGLSYAHTIDFSLIGLGTIPISANILPISAFVLIIVAFLIKVGAIGFHIWLPGSYAEAEDDTTSFMSSILSKTGIFGMLILLLFLLKMNMHHSALFLSMLGWIGIFTVFFGSLMAIFQEDVKYLLAYSSMGQLGYVVLCMAAMSHLGWVSGLYLAINHLFFKAMILLAVAGVISRVGTRNMYEMGGLIKKMPYSFISVLIGIIALSGVPPLSGFGAKWLIYTALLEKGWYFRAGLSFFASAIAFLYLFRLIHTIFLGQPKPQHKNVKEASPFFLIPQFIFIFAIMAISMFPSLIIKPLSTFISPYFASTILWQGNTLYSSLGYWNGNLVMYVTMGVFMLPLIWLIISIGRVQQVKQFNIVFAAERPFKPTTTHFAHNFYAHYKRALGTFVRPVVTGFWNGVGEWISSVAGTIRQIYSGNGQTYLLHILLYFVVLYFIMGGK